MKSIKILLFVLIGSLSFAFFACDTDEPEPQPEPQPVIELEFISLTSDKEILYGGETATITAEARGEELVYQWTASAGSIVGSGKTVTYTPAPCITGENTITCKITDKYKESLTKKIIITVE
ncbi:MAG: hypothetical protein KBG30_12285 [Bacteroidales bacterium]|nr:hypothetical protein [Bacteroidales bacterium]HPX75647.1 hypothetical protein [Bacteroidales bacterium]HQB21579.1 hypothetical protein [Bacteroidales bacterium]